MAHKTLNDLVSATSLPFSPGRHFTPPFCSSDVATLSSPNMFLPQEHDIWSTLQIICHVSAHRCPLTEASQDHPGSHPPENPNLITFSSSYHKLPSDLILLVYLLPSQFVPLVEGSYTHSCTRAHRRKENKQRPENLDIIPPLGRGKRTSRRATSLEARRHSTGRLTA